MTFEDYLKENFSEDHATTMFFSTDMVRKIWRDQQSHIFQLENELREMAQRYEQAKTWAGDCICRCPIQEL